MNYATKELREVMGFLDEARATEEALKQILRAMERGECIEVTFTSAHHSATDLCPDKAGGKLLEKILNRAATRVYELEKQEVYWCQEVAHADKQAKLNEQRRAAAFDELRRTSPPEGVLPLNPEENASA